jgi:tryptophan-rich sensory protein
MEGRVFNHQGGFKLSYSRRTEMQALAGFLAVTAFAGASGCGLAALNLAGWYDGLAAPPGLLPVGGVFAGWVIVLAAAAVAAWEVWRVPDVAMHNHRAVRIWGWMLAAKAAWTPIFFGLHWLAAADCLGVATASLAAAAAMLFRAHVPRAGWLMLPCVLWCSYLTYLDIGFWWLNV